MKVKCINKRDWLYITIGKTHEVIYENIIRDTFKIIDDDGDVGWFLKSRFIPLSEIRTEKINKLLEI
jgi:SH3-like domain-containing protein